MIGGMQEVVRIDFMKLFTKALVRKGIKYCTTLPLILPYIYFCWLLANRIFDLIIKTSVFVT